jgi:hypothetical protein
LLLLPETPVDHQWIAERVEFDGVGQIYLIAIAVRNVLLHLAERLTILRGRQRMVYPGYTRWLMPRRAPSFQPLVHPIAIEVHAAIESERSKELRHALVERRDSGLQCMTELVMKQANYMQAARKARFQRFQTWRQLLWTTTNDFFLKVVQ